MADFALEGIADSMNFPSDDALSSWTNVNDIVLKFKKKEKVVNIRWNANFNVSSVM